MASFKTVVKAPQDEGKGFLLEYLELQGKPAAENCLPFWITKVIEEYREVFQEPQGLPPPKRHDHAIVLKEGATIHSLRPYRYPPY